MTTKDTVYIASNPHSCSEPNHIAAFDIRTAKRTWMITAPKTPGVGTFIPIRAEGDGLIAYMLPGGRPGSRVVHLAPADGKQTTLLRMSEAQLAGTPERDMISTEVPDPALFKNGRLYLHRSGAFNEYTAGAPMTMILGTQ
ncbi:hypothetical protein ABZ729_31175 [Streptomyces sp. NPDC006678]|uniref:hypothetical protein n=1 Tax=Streptomyces sp. NPDC006678 TaxID=3157185 RepID=UPI0033FD18C1